MTLAAMEATFREYYDDDNAREKIPVLAMLTRSNAELKEEAEKLLATIRQLAPEIGASVCCTEDVVGGGSAPAAVLDGFGVAVECGGLSAQELEKKLREGELPVISRINHDQVLLDVRTLTADEYELIAARLREIDEELQA